MPGEDGAAPGVDFDLSDDAHPGPFEAEGKSANTGEKIEDIHFRSGQSRIAMTAPPVAFSMARAVANDGVPPFCNCDRREFDTPHSRSSWRSVRRVFVRYCFNVMGDHLARSVCRVKHNFTAHEERKIVARYFA